jgi:hypothetical protein
MQQQPLEVLLRKLDIEKAIALALKLRPGDL